ncbi:MAG: Fe-S-containing hydro-lyase, partial [Eubacteriales bacterium]|nr:Fe-S-containing hydro-lyase [Eubacteriales bacterium]
MQHIITEPYTKEKFAILKTGDTVLLSGTIFAARDTAHRKLVELMDGEEKLPFEIKDSIVYYMGPTPARPGYPSGSAGPTTSYRMDKFTPELLGKGLIGMIGKGPRSREVREAAKETGAVYFAAIGGAAALIAQCIKSSKVVAFEELGTEAIRKLEVKDMPLIVAWDSYG